MLFTVGEGNTAVRANFFLELRTIHCHADVVARLHSRHSGSRSRRYFAVDCGKRLREFEFTGELALTGRAIAKEVLHSKIQPHIPAGRPGKPEEIAGLIVYLFSDEAAFMTDANAGGAAPYIRENRF